MKASFLLYIDSLSILNRMPDELAGKFIKAIYLYQTTGELPEMDFALEMAIAPFVNQFQRDEAKYEKTVNRNSRNGSLGGRPPKTQSVNEDPKKPSGLSGNPQKPKKADTDTDSDSDTDTEPDTDTDTVPVTKKEKAPAAAEEDPPKNELQKREAQIAELRELLEEEKKKSSAKRKKDEPPSRVILMPFESDLFSEAWERWKAYKKAQFRFTYKSPESEQAALLELTEVSGGLEETALKIIKKSIANGWQGLFKLKDDHGKQSASNNRTAGESPNEAHKRDLARRMAGGAGTQ